MRLRVETRLNRIAPGGLRIRTIEGLRCVATWQSGEDEVLERVSSGVAADRNTDARLRSTGMSEREAMSETWWRVS